LARSGEDLRAEGYGVDVELALELGRVEEELHQARYELLLARLDRGGLEGREERRSGLPDLDRGDLEQLARDLHGAHPRRALQRRQHELALPSPGADEVSGKHCAPCVSRWCRPRPCLP